MFLLQLKIELLHQNKLFQVVKNYPPSTSKRDNAKAEDSSTESSIMGFKWGKEESLLRGANLDSAKKGRRIMPPLILFNVWKSSQLFSDSEQLRYLNT